MINEIGILATTALTLGFVHTITGPDHYLPFIVLSKARGWSLSKTSLITFLCGLGHILSSIVLGFIGIALGTAVFKLEMIEASRGDLAAWLLIIFGFTYFVWGVHKAVRYKPHEHKHSHLDGNAHSHSHKHFSEHSHVHSSKSHNTTPWIMFIIFVFGPCEPLIPLIMYPAAKHNVAAVIMVALVFGLATIMTMLGAVLVVSFGLLKAPIRGLERYSHALAGLTIFLCGGAIKFLGL